MSILSDLDPLHTRIQTPTTSGRKWSLTGLLALILAGGAGGIYFAYSASAENTQVSAKPLLAPPSASAQPTDKLALTTNPIQTDPGAAVIQRNTDVQVAESSATSTPGNAFRALQSEAPPPTRKATDEGKTVRKGPAKAKTAKESLRKTASTNQARKGNVKNARSDDGQAKKKLSAKPTERDIDIISAIVK